MKYYQYYTVYSIQYYTLYNTIHYTIYSIQYTYQRLGNSATQAFRVGTGSGIHTHILVYATYAKVHCTHTQLIRWFYCCTQPQCSTNARYAVCAVCRQNTHLTRTV